VQRKLRRCHEALTCRSQLRHELLTELSRSWDSTAPRKGDIERSQEGVLGCRHLTGDPVPSASPIGKIRPSGNSPIFGMLLGRRDTAAVRFQANDPCPLDRSGALWERVGRPFAATT
jgi:hypothetical protein